MYYIGCVVYTSGGGQSLNEHFSQYINSKYHMVHLFPCLEMSALYCIIILCLAMIFSVTFLLPDRLLIPFKPNTILITMIIVRYFTVITNISIYFLFYCTHNDNQYII